MMMVEIHARILLIIIIVKVIKEIIIGAMKF